MNGHHGTAGTDQVAPETGRLEVITDTAGLVQVKPPRPRQSKRDWSEPNSRIQSAVKPLASHLAPVLSAKTGIKGTNIATITKSDTAVHVRSSGKML